MAASNFVVRLHTARDTTTVVATGPVDLESTNLLQAALHEAVAQPDTAAVGVDLSAVPFLDSRGISVLVEARHAARERGIAYTVTGATGQVRRVLALTGLLKDLTVPLGTADPDCPNCGGTGWRYEGADMFDEPCRCARSS